MAIPCIGGFDKTIYLMLYVTTVEIGFQDPEINLVSITGLSAVSLRNESEPNWGITTAGK